MKCERGLLVGDPFSFSTLLRSPQCSSTGSVLSRFQVQGAQGAFHLGLAYGFLSGVCIFGFAAPILGIITMQEKIVTGFMMLLFFGIGHCLPLVVCGMFSSRTMELLHSPTGQSLVSGMRRLAAVAIAALGVYFLVIPFV